MPFLKSAKASLSSCSLSIGQMVLMNYFHYSALTKVLRDLADDRPSKFMGWALF